MLLVAAWSMGCGEWLGVWLPGDLALGLGLPIWGALWLRAS